MIDEKKLQQLLGKMIVDLGAAISVPSVRIGMHLGLYKAMNGAGPMSSAELSERLPQMPRHGSRSSAGESGKKAQLSARRVRPKFRRKRARI